MVRAPILKPIIYGVTDCIIKFTALHRMFRLLKKIWLNCTFPVVENDLKPESENDIEEDIFALRVCSAFI